MTTKELACKAIASCIRYGGDHSEETIAWLINEWRLTSDDFYTIEGYMPKGKFSGHSDIELPYRERY